MSSDVIARVDAFYQKADELGGKGHLLRAAENFSRAAEAARPLGEDNLVMLHMRLQRGHLLACFATAPDALATVDLRTLAAHRAEFIALLSGAIAVLERRRVAGTLLEGKCTAAEEAWYTFDPGRRVKTAGYTAADAASSAALIGYEQFLRAAKHATGVLLDAFWYAAECSDAQFQTFAQQVVHAAELMQQPRRHNDKALLYEAMFADALRKTVAETGARGLDARLFQLLAGAWERLQRSGVLQARRVEECIAMLGPAQQNFHAAVQSSLTAPGLRTCALPGCGAKEAHPAHFKSCAACRTVVYCCREHQVAGWPAHKKACKAARKAAAEEEDGAGPSGA